MIDRLGRDFVSTWMLAKELERMQTDGELPAALRAFAARVHASYQYPVDTQVYAPSGELLGQLAANELPPDASPVYLELLDSAARRSREDG